MRMQARKPVGGEWEGKFPNRRNTSTTPMELITHTELEPYGEMLLHGSLRYNRFSM